MGISAPSHITSVHYIMGFKNLFQFEYKMVSHCYISPYASWKLFFPLLYTVSYNPPPHLR